MNLLLVDDEAYVIESMKKNINWDEFPINQIYTAYSMAQAKTIMELIPIQLIISDIVMPHGSGFEFMSWAREEKYEVQVIFLTSYAEFDYAKRAIALESVDYLLKPIDFAKLTQSIMKAIQRVQEVRQIEKYREDSRVWNQNKQLLKKSFWLELCNGTMDEEHMEKEIEKRQLNYQNTQEFLGVFVHLRSKLQHQNREYWGDNILDFIIGNILNEMLSKVDFQIEAAFLWEGQKHVIVLKAINGKTCDETRFMESGILEYYIEWFGSKLHMDIWCGVGRSVKLTKFHKAVGFIQEMRENSLSIWNRVLYLSDFGPPRIIYQNTNFPMWETLIRDQKIPEILVSIKKYLEEMSQRELITRDILKKFRMDMIQLAYAWLAEQGIEAHLLFSDKDSEIDFQNALEDVDGAYTFARNLLTKAVQYTRYINKPDSVVDQLKQYMNQHYQEDIRRSDLAGLVYLNTDYMARIFKKETGISISTYILQKRVEEAIRLLTQSDLPINTISLYVGYSNFSYFTKMFRENTGYSPLEYRRNFKNK